MYDVTTTSDALLNRLATRGHDEASENVHILFCGLEQAEISLVTTAFRSFELAPRSRQIESFEDFRHALGERSWDLLFLGASGFMTVASAHTLIRQQDKRVSIIQLIHRYEPKVIARGLRDNAQAVVSLQEPELLTSLLWRELQNHRMRTELHQSMIRLGNAEKRCLKLIEASEEPIALCDANQVLICNKAFAEVFGYHEADQLISEAAGLEKLIAPAEHKQLTKQLISFLHRQPLEDEARHTCVRADTTQFKASLNLQPAYRNTQALIQITLQGVTRDSTSAFANQDPITGLYSREYLLPKLSKLLGATLEGAEDWNLIYIQLDNFRNIRAETGLEGCDLIARDIADILRLAVGPAHTLARLNDDTFIILYMDASSDQALKLCDTLCARIYGHISHTQQADLHTSCSIGIVHVTENAPHTDTLLERARTTASSLNDSSLKGGVKLYVPETPKKAPDTRIIEQLEKALDQNRLRLLYQPIVPLNSEPSDTGNYEVLLRLINEQDEEISPNLFLTSLENTELCKRIDRWVISHALEQMRTELDEGRRQRLFISLSGRTLADTECPQWLAEQLRRLRLPAERLVFQISETDLCNYMAQAKAFTRALKAMHCCICIKHFGSSSQSHSCCVQIPADYLKLDGAFVQELNQGDAQNDFQLIMQQPEVKSAVTIAPLVETTQVMSQLWKAGVNYIQGFYLQPPREKMDYDFFE